MKQINTYDRNTSIMMRLKVNYLGIFPPIMVCHILNYLIIAPRTLKCSTAWIVQASVTSWSFQTKIVIECAWQMNIFPASRAAAAGSLTGHA